MSVIEKLKFEYEARPVWMNLVMLFCFYMTFVYLPFDFFIKPVAEDQEVWFGYLLTGWAAKATEPLHWAIYGAGAYGLLKMKSWIWPWALIYVCQVAISMFVWSLADDRGSGLLAGLLMASPFVLLAVMFWRAKDSFDGFSDVSVRGSGNSDPSSEVSKMEGP